MTTRISAVINTFNEEKNLPYALRSVRPWVDEIVIVDMHSEDGTVEVARSFEAKIYLHERLGFADPARAFAVKQATGDWILMLDADELIPRSLSAALQEIARGDLADVVAVPRLNYIFGSPIMHSCSGPSQDRQFRFFRPGFLNLTGQVHNFAHPAVGSRILHLPYEPGRTIVHFTYIDFSHYLQKFDSYTTIEAEQAARLGEQPTIRRALARASKIFIRYYFIGGGYRDGWRGFYFAAASGFYRIFSYAKLTLLCRLGSRESILNLYRSEAERLLQEYHS